LYLKRDRALSRANSRFKTSSFAPPTAQSQHQNGFSRRRIQTSQETLLVGAMAPHRQPAKQPKVAYAQGCMEARPQPPTQPMVAYAQGYILAHLTKNKPTAQTCRVMPRTTIDAGLISQAHKVVPPPGGVEPTHNFLITHSCSGSNIEKLHTGHWPWVPGRGRAGGRG
jgi:hypothetical protein